MEVMKLANARDTLVLSLHSDEISSKPLSKKRKDSVEALGSHRKRNVNRTTRVSWFCKRPHRNSMFVTL